MPSAKLKPSPVCVACVQLDRAVEFGLIRSRNTSNVALLSSLRLLVNFVRWRFCTADIPQPVHLQLADVNDSLSRAPVDDFADVPLVKLVDSGEHFGVGPTAEDQKVKSEDADVDDLLLKLAR
jgi:hypothetical protein